MTNEKGKLNGNARWCISFELEEELEAHINTTKETQHQREMTHAIARGISAIAASDEHLKIVDYKILKNGKEQPEADALHMKWAKECQRLEAATSKLTKS